MKFSDIRNEIMLETYNEVVNEGWGTIILTLMNPGFRASLEVIGLHEFKEIIRKEPVKKYIAAECDKILAEEKRKDKSVTDKVPSTVWSNIKKNFKGFFSKGGLYSYLANSAADRYTVGKYEVYAYGDTSHIEGGICLSLL